jgi:hypothetical protein
VHVHHRAHHAFELTVGAKTGQAVVGYPAVLPVVLAQPKQVVKGPLAGIGGQKFGSGARRIVGVHGVGPAQAHAFG